MGYYQRQGLSYRSTALPSGPESRSHSVEMAATQVMRIFLSSFIRMVANCALASISMLLLLWTHLSSSGDAPSC